MYGLKNVRQRHDDSLSRTGWDRLEVLLAVYYRGKGYAIEHVGTGGTGTQFDGGIDLKLRRGDEYIVVECKHWNAKQVTHNAVHQLFGVMSSEGAIGAILVTSGEFTPHAKQSAARLGKVQLIEGAALRDMLGPLPEPAAAPQTVGSARAIASMAGERFVAAAESRIRGDRKRKSPWATLLQVLVVGVIALLFFKYVEGQLDRFQAGVAQRSAARPIQHQAATPPVMQSPRAVPEPVYSPPPPVEVQRPRPPTPAEIRESQRKADEAIKVLAPNVKEI